MGLTNVQRACYSGPGAQLMGGRSPKLKLSVVQSSRKVQQWRDSKETKYKVLIVYNEGRSEPFILLQPEATFPVPVSVAVIPQC